MWESSSSSSIAICPIVQLQLINTSWAMYIDINIFLTLARFGLAFFSYFTSVQTISYHTSMKVMQYAASISTFSRVFGTKFIDINRCPNSVYNRSPQKSGSCSRKSLAIFISTIVQVFLSSQKSNNLRTAYVLYLS